MKRILSIQSHVAYGYVGNRAAVFPLQRMGFDVTVINTVQYSNHPGYGRWTGENFSEAHIRNIIDGLRDLGVLHTFDAVLSGYLGHAAIGETILEAVAEIKRHNPDCIYCCDPVMGDVGRGLFVKPDIPSLFRDKATAIADILTPNLFELEQLSGITIQSLEEAKAACRKLHDKGVGTVLVTSLIHNSTPPNSLQMLASRKNEQSHIITTPHLAMTPMPSGTGDLTAALYLGHTLNKHNDSNILSHTAGGVFAILEATAAANAKELYIIQSQAALVESGPNGEKPRFCATPTP